MSLQIKKQNAPPDPRAQWGGAPLLPPYWLVFPGFQRGSAVWRMGGGEAYFGAWWAWRRGLSPKRGALYDAMFPQPKGFRDLRQEPAYDCGTAVHRVRRWSRNGRPSYSLPELYQDLRQGNSMEFLYFWKPERQISGLSPGCLSQWWMSEFRLDAVERFCCAEQYMMAEKARLFGDERTHREIMACRDPLKLKKLGRRVSGFTQEAWEKSKYAVVLNGNYQKFMQDPALRHYLLSTCGKVLVEASPFDDIWGIRMTSAEAKASGPDQWRGENLLGFALMEVREEIRRVCAYEDLADWGMIRGKYGCRNQR